MSPTGRAEVDGVGGDGGGAEPGPGHQLVLRVGQQRLQHHAPRHAGARHRLHREVAAEQHGVMLHDGIM